MSTNPSRAPTRAQTATSGRDGVSSRRSSNAPRSRSLGSMGIRKAQYRPLVTVARRRTASRMSSASTTGDRARQGTSLQPDQLSTIDEDQSDAGSIITALTNEIAKPRYVYNPPVNEYAAREMGLVTQYLNETRVSDNMLSISQGLLARPNLPYNPYPGILKRMTHLQEGFHMHKEREDTIRSTLQNPLQKTSTPSIWGVKGQTNVWGLKDIVHVVDPKAISEYAWLAASVQPPKMAEVEDSHVRGDILLALTGPAVFTGTFYRDPPTVDFSLEFMMYGTDRETALRVFSKTMRDDVKRTVSSSCPHQFIGILVSSGSKQTLWDKRKIEVDKDGFYDAVETAVLQKRPPLMKTIFAVTERGSVYKAGSKKYTFHFIQADEDTGAERFSSFSEHPYTTLFSSVYLRKADAEGYVAAFRRHQALGGRGVTQGATRGESRNHTVTRRGRRDDAAQKHVTTAAIGEDVKEPIREDWERELARMNPDKGDALKYLHVLLLVILMDRSKYKVEELVDIYRFLHSTASDFSIAAAIIPLLRLFVRQSDESKQEFATSLFLTFKKRLLSVLDPVLHERSSDQQAAHAFLKTRLDGMTDQKPNGKGSLVHVLPLGLQTAVQLLQLDHYCTTVQLGLSEEALSLVKQLQLQEVMRMYRQKFPDEVPRPKTRLQVLPETNKKKKGTKISQKPAVILKHGVEANSIVQQRNLFVNVEWSLQTSMHPVVMATEGVLMQYLIDMKLDQVWKGYLMELMNADHLPPNPYPRLLTRLRQAACKMQLWRESDAKLKARLLHGEATTIDRANHVYQLEGCGGYGTAPALALVMASSFKKLVVLTDLMTNRDVVSHKGQFQLSCGLAVSGHSPLYGRMMPYLPYLELHEHYYIRGPLGANEGAIQLFAKLVYDNIADLCSTNTYAIRGLFVDNVLVLAQDRLEEDQDSAERAVADAARSKKILYLKIYYAVGWRYIAIHKHFMMHYLYVDQAEDRHQAYFPDDPIYLYQNVFLSLDQAVSHYQQSGASMKGNPLSASNVGELNRSIDEGLLDSLQDKDLLGVHKLLIIKALTNKGADYLSDTWRMLHSMAFQLEYIASLVQSLVDLLRYVLASPGSLETLEHVEETRAAQAKAKKGTTVPVKKFPVRATVLGYMVTAFREKVLEVIHEPCSMVPQALPLLINEKLKEIAERNPETGELFLIIEKSTTMRLTEILDLLEPVQAAIEHDVHQACNKVQDALKHLNSDR